MFHATTSSLSWTAKPSPTNRFNHRNIGRSSSRWRAISTWIMPHPLPPSRIYIANYIESHHFKEGHGVEATVSNHNHLSIYRINSTRVTDSTASFLLPNREIAIALLILAHVCNRGCIYIYIYIHAYIQLINLIIPLFTETFASSFLSKI